MLQTKKNGLPPTELLSESGYGVCQLVATLAIIPVTLYAIRMRVLDVREQARQHLQQLADDDDTLVKNSPDEEEAKD